MRVVMIFLLCLIRQPFMIYESRRFQTGIAKQVITPWPVFIIGHWRSGTTYLQNLLSEDRQFGRVSLLQAAMPHEFLTLPAIARDILNRILPTPFSKLIPLSKIIC